MWPGVCVHKCVCVCVCVASMLCARVAHTCVCVHKFESCVKF